MKRSGLPALVSVASLSILVSACTVKLEAPDKPIHIIGDFTIKHEIVVKVERELDKALSEDSGLF
ncbi:YnbE family lipoprotein [Kangiella aquimarina]|uniref:YnbE family lipoprotein n=1 Tax=Kangiella aquimarina TaxID=261965 RepID=A0ABZ0X4B9_9GAMM|nr:YnbE family lipoprotein [Kangiella aquimarina]WQG85442.1 YnbE family lipoprotein [Kangiella aquimarina]